ncbi:MAG: hypothetical protein Q9170_005484 [Blastenia crenularia]
MDPPEDPAFNIWGSQQPSRPPSNVSYNPYLPSNSSSPTHGNHSIPPYQSPYRGPAYYQTNEPQRQIYDHTHLHRPNFAVRPPVNGGVPRPFSGHPAPNPFQPTSNSFHPGRPQFHPHSNVPNLPPPDELHEQQLHVRELLEKLQKDREKLLEGRRATAAQLKRLQAELDGLEARQRGGELLGVIYPLQAELGEVQRVHDGYGREWDNVDELLEMCWAELAVPDKREA